MGSRSNEIDLERASGLLEKLKLKFRRQLIRGASPKIEDYLMEVPKNLEMELFGILLELEVRFRQQKGGTPTSAHYHRRYPRFAKPIRHVFFESTVDSDLGSKPTDRKDDLLTPPTLELQQPDRLGDYSIVREIGQGAMGEVCEACHLKTGHRVALKKLPIHLAGKTGDPSRLARFRNEFRSLCEVNHRNLVGMHHLGVDGEQWFFTMDLIEGEDFLSYVRPDGKLNEPRLRSCLKQMAEGILKLHRLRKLHRDLKPSNVMVTADGKLVILDFGLVAEIQADVQKAQTASAIFSGTPPYAAPEQFGNHKTEANDWYGFGTMLYEALVGEVPFPQQESEAYKLMLRKQQEDPPKLSGRAELPADLCELADGLIQRDVALRFGAEAVVEYLKLNEETKDRCLTRTVDTGSSLLGPDDWVNAGLSKDIVLVGREKQLCQLERVTDSFLKDGGVSLVWVTGNSGEGKTSLVEKFLTPIRVEKKVLVLSGRCYDRESIPFKVVECFIDSLTAYLKSLSDEEVMRLLPLDIDMLVHLFPLLRRIRLLRDCELGARLGYHERQKRNLAFVALKELIRGISDRVPVVVFVDDLQWGDADSADIFIDMLTADNPPSFMFIGCVRRDEMESSAFLQKLDEIAEGKTCKLRTERVEVEPLTDEQCLEFLKCRLKTPGEASESDMNSIVNAAKGNPYFLEQITEGVDADSGEINALTLEEMVSQRLARCGPESKALLEVIAVAGKAIAAEDVIRINASNDDSIGALSRLRKDNLVRLVGTAETERVDTYHDKIRETILHTMPGDVRRQLHEKIATVTEQKYLEIRAEGFESENELSAALAFDLAHHYFEAGNAKSFQYLVQAGELSLRAFAFANALDEFKKAALFKAFAASDAEIYALYVGLGKALLGCGRSEESLPAFESALEVAGTDFEKAVCEHGKGGALVRLGQVRRGNESFHLALRLVKSKLPKTMFGTLLFVAGHSFLFHLLPRRFGKVFFRDNRSEQDRHLGTLIHQSVQYDGWIDIKTIIGSLVQRATLAKYSDDASTKALGFSAYAANFPLIGLPEIGGKILERGLSKAKESKDKQILAVVKLNAGSYHYLRGKFDESLSYLKEASAVLKRERSFDYLMTLHWQRHIASIQGHAQEIIASSLAELEAAEFSKDDVVVAAAKYGLADGYARCGDRFNAIAMGKESVHHLVRTEHMIAQIARQELGRAYLLASDYEKAIGVLEENWRAIRKSLFFAELTMDTLALLVESKLGANWFTKASPSTGIHRHLYWFLRLSGTRFPTLRPHVMRVSGRAMAARGRTSAARKFFRKAQEAAEKIGANYEQARALIDQSMLDYSNSKVDRQAGLKLLESLGCVLPDAELEYLEIDREAHFGRARDARETDAKKMEKFRG